MIYLTPLLFIGLALVLERRRLSLPATALATAFAPYVVSATPYRLDLYPYYEAHGLSIAALANRIPRWPADTIETALILVALGSGAALVALGLVRARRPALAAAASIAVFALAWSLTTEIYAANGEKRASDQAFAGPAEARGLGRPDDRRRADALIGQGITDPNPHLAARVLESVDRVVLGNGRQRAGAGRRTPNLDEPTDTVAPDLGAEFAVVRRGVADRGAEADDVGDMRVLPPSGQARPAARDQPGVAPDGWSGDASFYTRYDVTGRARLCEGRLSPASARASRLPPAIGTERVGPVAVDESISPDRHGHGARTTRAAGVRVPPSLRCRVPVAVEVTIAPTSCRRARRESAATSAARRARSRFELCPVGPR